MRFPQFFSALLATTLFCGLANSQATSQADDQANNQAGEESIETLASQVRASENAFAATMANRDLQAFATFIADDAVFFGDGALRGKQAVVAGWKALYAGEQAPFSWKSASVEVLATGTLAHSSGPVFDRQGRRTRERSIRSGDGNATATGRSYSTRAAIARIRNNRPIPNNRIDTTIAQEQCGTRQLAPGRLHCSCVNPHLPWRSGDFSPGFIPGLGPHGAAVRKCAVTCQYLRESPECV
ncbi:MAG TPA: nuclear transport factor 2 family protein [Steroidobacteraceae bacterium]